MVESAAFRVVDDSYRVIVVDCGFGIARIVVNEGAAVLQVMTPANMSQDYFIPAQSVELLLDEEAIRQLIEGLRHALADQSDSSSRL